MIAPHQPKYARQAATEGIHADSREEMQEFARKFELEPNGVEKDHALVRYDNETGKGDHRHCGRREERYEFAGMARLIEDFVADVERMGDIHG